MIEERQRHRFTVACFDHDLPGRRGAPNDQLLPSGIRQSDLLDGGLDAAGNRAIIEPGGEVGFSLHFIAQPVIAEIHLTAVAAVVERRYDDEGREETTARVRAASRGDHHLVFATSTMMLTQC